MNLYIIYKAYIYMSVGYIYICRGIYLYIPCIEKR
uniref:Uncharacterized protein n=1 Tax=viral metagenome TaxID=1070528 RepID=A0A6C0CF52_9ZZZZ